MHTFCIPYVFVRGIHLSPMDSWNTGPVMQSWDGFYSVNIDKLLTNSGVVGEMRRFNNHVTSLWWEKSHGFTDNITLNLASIGKPMNSVAYQE